MKLYSLALFAVRHEDDSLHALIESRHIVADNEQQAESEGLELYRREHPAAEGWLSHSCVAALIPTHSFRLNG